MKEAFHLFKAPQTVSEAHQTSNTKSVGDFCTGGIAAGVRNWPFTAISADIKNNWSYTSILHVFVSFTVTNSLAIFQYRPQNVRKGLSVIKTVKFSLSLYNKWTQ